MVDAISTGFDSAASGSTGYQTGATSAGTFYAKQQNAGSGNCTATYPETHANGFSLGSSFLAAVNNP
jgi:hypothetical protein